MLLSREVRRLIDHLVEGPPLSNVPGDVEKRRDDALRKALVTPPTPHDTVKVSRGKNRRGLTTKANQATDSPAKKRTPPKRELYTLHSHDSDGTESADRPTRIEVTPAMIEAGELHLFRWNPERGVSAEISLRRIFLAMLDASRPWHGQQQREDAGPKSPA